MTTQTQYSPPQTSYDWGSFFNETLPNIGSNLTDMISQKYQAKVAASTYLAEQKAAAAREDAAVKKAEANAAAAQAKAVAAASSSQSLPKWVLPVGLGLGALFVGGLLLKNK